MAERRKKMSLSVSPNLGAGIAAAGTMSKGSKPAVPAKPAHIRPGLKPVKIPTVDDKVLVSFENRSLVLKTAGRIQS
jgi:hypothetical protein